MSDFWARRKAAVEAEAREEALAAKAQEQALREADLSERTDEDILAELDLPDPDTLEAGDDFKVFLTETVPARIRTRALRRLWRLNPVLANVDGLVDYGEDFNDSSFLLGNLQTAYQVGKGMTEHVLELARQAEEAAHQAETDAGEDTPELDAQEAAAEADAPVLEAESKAEASEAARPTDTAVNPQEEQFDDQPIMTPTRRMRFAFDAATSTTPTTTRTQTPSDAPDSAAHL